jgi:ribosome-associated translation inhibitor RaiA
MELALQVTYRDLMQSDALDALIRDEVKKLERFFPRIISCQVLVERAYRHPRVGSPYHVRIEIGLPGDRLTINSEPNIRTTLVGSEDPHIRKDAEVSAAHKDAALAVRDAFRRAKRRIQDYSRLIRGDVKRHEPRPAPAGTNE